jgi:hypothetical protein
MSYSRRFRVTVAALTAGGVVAALFAAASATTAEGASGDGLVLGQNNWSTTTTYLNWHSNIQPIPNSGLAVVGMQTGAVFATNEEYVHGDPTWIDGIRAFGNDRGGFFYGVNDGVVATSEDVGLDASAQELGVKASGDTAVEAVGDNVGLVANGPVAIRAEGAVSFSSAGLLTIPIGASSAAVTPGTDITGSSMILATAQTPGGQVLRVARNSTADTLRIYLTAPASQAVQVAYFVIG